MRNLYSQIITLLLLISLSVPFAQGKKPTSLANVLVNNKTTPKKLKKVYIPISELEAILQQDKQGVLLPKEMFDKLLKGIKKKSESPDYIPRGILVKEVLYQARIEKKQLVISATMQLRQYEEGWQSLLLPFSNLSLEKATLNGKPAQLGRDRKKNYQLVLFSNQQGKMTLELQLTTPLGTIGSDQVSAFHLAGTASETFALELPAGKHLFVDGLKVLRPTKVDQVAKYVIAVGGKKSLQLRISDEQKEQTTDSLLFASSQYGLHATPGEVTWQSITTLRVYGKSLDQLTFKIPKSLEIVSVESTGLEMWELEDSTKNNDKTNVTLRYRQPFHGSRQIVFRGVLSTKPQSNWQVPTLILSKATSHVGRILIDKPTGVRLKLNKNRGTRQVDSPQSRTSNSLAFDIWQEDFTLQFVTQSRRRELRAALTTLVDINRNGLDLHFAASLETLFEPLFRLEMSLPAEWVITDIRMNNKKVPWQTVIQNGGTHRIQITLPRPLLPGNKQSLSMTAHRDLEEWPPTEKTTAVNLPNVLLPQVDIVEGTLAVRTEKTFTITENEENESGELEPAELKSPGISMGWRYQKSDYSCLVDVVQKPLQLSVQSISSTHLDPQAIRSNVQMILDVAGSGIQSIQIVLPEEVREDVRFRVMRGSVRIVEQTASKPAKGKRTWRLHFDRRFRGQLQLAVELTIPRIKNEQKGKSYRLPNLRVVGAERQNGFIAIVASDEQQISIKTDDKTGGKVKQPLRPIDPADFPAIAPPATGRMIAAFRYIVPGYRVLLTEIRFDRAAVPTAICQLGNHQTQLDATGELLHRFEYQFQAVGVQSLQVQLPKGLELWSAFLDGKPIEVRRDKNILQISLTTKIKHQLELTASSHGNPLRTTGSITEQPPQLSILDGSGNQQPLEVLEQNWTVHYPNDTIITESNGLFHPEKGLPRQGLLNQLRNSFHFVPAAQLWVHAIMVLVVIMLMTIFVRAFKRWRFIGVLGVGILAGLFLAVTYTLLVISPRIHSENDRVASYAPRSETTLSDKNKPQSHGGGFGGTGGAGGFGGGIVADPFRREGKAKSKEELTPQQKFRTEAAPSNESKLLPNKELSMDFEEEKERRDITINDGVSKIIFGNKLGVKAKRGARLSVAVQFQPAAEMRSLQLHHIGEGGAEQAGLQLQYANVQAASHLFWAVFVGVLLLFWLLRKRGWKCLTFCFIAGLVFPLALFTFVPGRCLTVLDGLFFGTLTALSFHLLLQVLLFIKQNLFQPVSNVFAGNTAGILIAFCLIFAGQNLFAQRQNRTQQITSVPRPASRKVKEIKQEENIYYAYESGKDPLAAKQVFVPYDIYRKIWDQAHPQDRIKTTAPIKGIVTAATYSARLIKGENGKIDRARVQGRIVLHSFRSKRIVLALPVGRVSIHSASLDGKKAILVANPQQQNQPLSVVVSQSGLHILDITFDLAVKTNGAAGEFTLPLHVVPAGRFTLTLPQAELEVLVNGGSENFRRETKEKISTVAIPVDKGGKLTVAWQPKQQNGGTNATIHAESLSYLSVDDGGISMKSHYQFRVHQGSVKEILFAFPEEIKLRKISGNDVSGWEIIGEGKKRRLKVFLRRAVTKTTALYFDQFLVHEIDGKQNDFALPQFYPLQVARDVGQIGIAAQRHFQLQGKATTGISQINLNRLSSASWMNKDANKPLKLAYRTIARPFDLRLRLSRREAKKQAKAEHLLLVGRRKIHIGSNLVITSQEVPQSRFVFNLPKDFLLLDVKATGLRDWYVVEEKKRRRRRRVKKLVIELNKPYIGRVDVLLNGTVPYEPEDSEVATAVPTITQVDRLTSELIVRFDETAKAKVADEGDWKSISPQKVATWLRKTGHQAQFAFRSTEVSPGAVEFELLQPEPKFSAETVTVFSLTDTFLHYSINIKWNIQQGTFDSFSFLTSDRFKDRLNIQARGIRYIITDTEGLKSGQMRWTIFLHRPPQKQFFVTATATLPPTKEDYVTSPQITVEGVLNSEEEMIQVKQRHFVVLVNQSHFQLSRKEKEKRNIVSAETLPVAVSKPLLDQAVEIVQVPAKEKSIKWQIQRFSQQQSAPAVINYANLVTVLSRDGSWKTEVTYNIRNRSRQFLPVQLPPKSRLLSVFVKGKPSRPSTTMFQSTTKTKGKKQEAVLLIPLPHSSYTDPSFDVKLIVAGRLASGELQKGFLLSGQTIDLPQIHVYSTTKSKQYGISVSRTNWTVHVPKEFDTSAVDDRNRNNLEESTSEKSTFYQLQSLSREVDEMMSLSLESRSRGKKERSLNNLKQLEKQLRSNSDANRSSKDRKNITSQNKTIQERAVLLQKIQAQQEILVKEIQRSGKQKRATENSDLRDSNEVDQKQGLQQQAKIQFESNTVRWDIKKQIGIQPDEEYSKKLQSRIKELVGANARLQVQKKRSRKHQNKWQNITRYESSNRQAQRKLSESQLETYSIDKAERSYSIHKESKKLFNFHMGYNLSGGRGSYQTDGDAKDTLYSPPPKWSSTGGLSLEITIPVDGQVFTFSKVGGEPRLAINLRPAKVRSSSLEFLWSFVWLAGGVVVLWFIYRTTTPCKLFKILPILFVVLGLLLFFTLPVQIGWIGFLFFCCGAIIISIQRAKVQNI